MDQRHHHRIADLEMVGAGAGRCDGSGGLVAIDSRQVPAPGAIGKGDVRVADRHRVQRHLDLAMARRRDLDILDHERRAELVANGCLDGLHLVSSLCPVRPHRGAGRALLQAGKRHLGSRPSLVPSPAGQARRNSHSDTPISAIDTRNGAPGR